MKEAVACFERQAEQAACHYVDVLSGMGIVPDVTLCRALAERVAEEVLQGYDSERVDGLWRGIDQLVEK